MTWEEDMMERMNQVERSAKQSQYRCDNFERSILATMENVDYRVHLSSIFQLALSAINVAMFIVITQVIA